MKTIHLLYNNQYFKIYLYWIVSLNSTPEMYKSKFKKKNFVDIRIIIFFCYNSNHFP